jgi:L-aminopeptidase/D-esterase-like protein
MKSKTFGSLVLVLMLVLDSPACEPRKPSGLSAGEPQKSPPTRSTVENRIVRARDLGIPFDGMPGKFNAITDVAGVEVGYSTLINGEGKLVVGEGPVRTGVTAILPRGHAAANDPVYAAVFSLNGNGKMTGTAWVEESGFLEGPILITNTHSVGVARDAVIAWRYAHGGADAQGFSWSLPVVAETWDGWLNDVNGFHVKPEHVFHALDTAHGGAIEEGSVGGGTGMICYEFKGGNGTASRKIEIKIGRARQTAEESAGAARTYMVGIFVQANFGRRALLTIAGVPVGKEIPGSVYKEETGSCIAVVATDAPLLPNQLKRLARRVSIGLARTGTISGNGSGDLFIAFSTANSSVAAADQITHSVQTIPNDLMDPIFNGVVQATEEAVVNALVDQSIGAAPSRVWQVDKATGRRFYFGRDNHRVDALPHDRVRALLKKYNQLAR